MDEKTKFEEEIVCEVKEMIISDASLTYGKRNSFDRFITRIEQGQSFEEAIGPLLRNLNRLKNKEIQSQGLSCGTEKIFNKLSGKYDIPLKKETFILWWSGKLTFFFNFVEKYLN
ncbi:hypothetical protein AALM99_03895 [Lactococcus muris]|uniref:Uncharacterized protein n=1 Tax=Lactococcus muris TaxID=2941330 RepID=A0ABV4DAF6_9LACT